MCWGRKVMLVVHGDDSASNHSVGRVHDLEGSDG
jgi:hypothetical protein